MFHEKRANGVLEAFRGNANCAQDLHNVTNHVGSPRNISGENMTRPEKSKNVPKPAKINSYNTRFRTFQGPELRTPRDASYEHGWSLEMIHVVWNEYMDAFTFISRQF